MKQKTKDKLDRIVAIQQQMFGLEQELDRLLGSEEKIVSGQVNHRGPSRRADFIPPEVKRESNASIKEIIITLGSSQPRFTRMDVMAVITAKGIQTTRLQVSQILRYMEKNEQIQSYFEQNQLFYSLMV